MIGQHRPTCGCAYCVRPVVSAVINRGPDRDERRASLATIVEQQINELLADAPSDWHGGREITDSPEQYHYGCQHRRCTVYPAGTYCRDCGWWVSK